MGAGPAEVEALQREPVARVPEQGSPREELVERRLSVERVTFREPEVALEVGGRKDTSFDDEIAEAGSVVVEGSQHEVAELVAPLLPAAVPEVIGGVLHEDAGDVTSL